MYLAGKHHLRVSRSYSALLAVTLSVGSAVAVLLTGCGNQYRPVVSSINPVGPAGQPTKYAIAISSPSATQPGLVTAVDFSGDTVITTPQILANPSYFIIGSSGTEGYVINAQGSLNFFGLSNPGSLITSQVAQTTLPINAGPVSLSAIAPASGSSTIFVPELTTSKIAALNAGSGALYQETAVPANPVYVVGSNGAERVYAISQGTTPGTSTGVVSALESVTGTSLSISATLPVGVLPSYGVMTADARRAFILNQGSANVSVINVINNAADSSTPTITLPVIPLAAGGSVAPHPVWADLSAIYTELLVLNQGDSATVSGQNYAGAYSAATTYTQNQVVSYNGGLYIAIRAGSTVGQLPTNATYFSQLHPGSLSIVSIPLCSGSTPVVGPNCSATNPTDASNFGQIIGSPNVGIAPTMVSVLSNSNLAYVINQFDSTGACTIGQGSVSVVNITSGLVTATICGAPSGSISDGLIHGHPNSVSATSGNPTGKVYVTSGDSTDLSVIYTDTNTVNTHITLQGAGLRVLVTQP